MTRPRRTWKDGVSGATSYDVARSRGMPQLAFSRCFAPKVSIAPATPDRIAKVAARLDTSNALAQGPTSGRTNLVAVLISSLTNLYYPEVLDLLSHRLTTANFRVQLFSLNAESEVNTMLDQAGATVSTA